MHVVATAGHVDHGKSTLVQALTGTNPDRLAEEKERGLTIDLGFAFTTLPSGRKISFVDVPGHIRFIKNMLAGVGGVDACVFVVAATEGWKPQSEEHLRILELLGIRHGVVALTQIGLVDDELAQLARMDVEENTEGSFLEDAEIVAVDSVDGTGIKALREALDNMTELAPTAPNNKRPRLWIDRSFAATGAGSVVTGTLTGGRLRVDDEISLVPGTKKARIGVYKRREKHAPKSTLVTELHSILRMSSISFSGEESLSRSTISGIEHRNLMLSFKSYLTLTMRCRVEGRSRSTSDRGNGPYGSGC